MSPEIISVFFKEKSPIFFSVILISSSVLLFGPESLLKSLGGQQIVEQNRTAIGAAFLFSLAFISVFCSSFVFKKIARKLKSNSNRIAIDKLRTEYMNELTAEEILYLLPFWAGINTLYFILEDGVRGGLEAKDIIYRASNTGSRIDGFAYNIQPWALKFLREHPEVYEKYVGKIETEEDMMVLYKDGKPWERKLW